VWFFVFLICVVEAIRAGYGVVFPYQAETRSVMLLMSAIMAIVGIRAAWRVFLSEKYKPWMWFSVFLICVVVAIVAAHETNIQSEPWDWSFLFIISFLVGVVAITYAVDGWTGGRSFWR
jgi:hypothetical protein